MNSKHNYDIQKKLFILTPKNVVQHYIFNITLQNEKKPINNLP